MPYALAPPEVRRILQRERKWVFAGAAVLAGVAGYVNVVLLGFYHVPVSHMSGAVSRLSMDLATSDLEDFRLVLAIFCGFLFGAALSGLIIGGTQLKPGRRYGATLGLEGILLAVATLLLMRGNSMGVALAAMACGLQNAMASSYYGLIIRTTHVTGIVTDLGVLLGHWLRHRRIPHWKVGLLLSILFGFLIGGLCGGLVYAWIGTFALAIASAGCLLAGGIYGSWLHRARVAEAAAAAESA